MKKLIFLYKIIIIIIIVTIIIIIIITSCKTRLRSGSIFEICLPNNGDCEGYLVTKKKQKQKKTKVKKKRKISESSVSDSRANKHWLNSRVDNALRHGEDT